MDAAIVRQQLANSARNATARAAMRQQHVSARKFTFLCLKLEGGNLKKMLELGNVISD